MVPKSFPNMKSLKGGITLIEIVVVIFIIALFSTILIVNFPEIQRRMALSRSTYKLAQDLRRTMDLALSGVPLKDNGGTGTEIMVKGYGIYVNLGDSTKQYVIYADVAGAPDPDNNYIRTSDQMYGGDGHTFCSEIDQVGDINSGYSDCIVETIHLTEESLSIYIKRINNIDYPLNGFTSINFSPPNPVINITNHSNNTEIGIVLGIIGVTTERTVSINTSGAINVQ